VQCGYHIKLGKKLTGAKVKSSGHSDGHAATAEDMLERARASIEADKEAKKNEMNEGSSLWSILAIFLYATGFLVMMLMLPGSKAFNAGGGLLILSGLVGVAYSVVRIAMVGFEENLLHGFMSIVLFVIYPIMKWAKCGPFYMMMLSSCAVIGVGGAMLWIAGILAEAEEKASMEDVGKGSYILPLSQDEMYVRYFTHSVVAARV
jgi:cation transport ATPase